MVVNFNVFNTNIMVKKICVTLIKMKLLYQKTSTENFQSGTACRYAHIQLKKIIDRS